MYEDYFENYGPYHTYQSDYDDYWEYNNEYYDLNNDYNRFIARQVNTIPYNSNYIEKNYIDISNLYPEIYKKVLPIIDRKLKSNAIISDKDSLDKITFEIYDEVANTDIGKKLNLKDETNTSTNKNSINVNSSGNKMSNQGMNKYAPNISKTITNSQNTNKNDITKEVSCIPVKRNSIFCDLIKIIILNNLDESSKSPKPGQNIPNVRPSFNYRPQPPRPMKPRPVFPVNMSQYTESNIPKQVRPNYFDVPYPEDS